MEYVSANKNQHKKGQSWIGSRLVGEGACLLWSYRSALVYVRASEGAAEQRWLAAFPGSGDGMNQSPSRRKRARGERGCVLVRTREGLQEAIYFETATLRGQTLRQKVLLSSHFLTWFARWRLFAHHSKPPP
jgi:hypothetical protein